MKIVHTLVYVLDEWIVFTVFCGIGCSDMMMTKASVMTMSTMVTMMVSNAYGDGDKA